MLFKSVYRKRRVRALAITSVAVFLLSCLILAWPTNGFVSRGRIDVRLLANKESMQPLNRLVRAIIENRTSNENLINQIYTIQRNDELDDGRQLTIGEDEAKRLRDSLKISMAAGKRPDSYQMTVELMGEKLVLPKQFLGQFCRSIATDFETHELAWLDVDGPSGSSYDLDQLHEKQTEELQQAKNLLNNIQDEVETMRSQLASFEYQDPESHDSFKTEEDSLARLESRKRQEALKDRLDVLVDERERLERDYTNDHPEVVELQSKIERIRFEIVGLDDAWNSSSPNEPTQFKNVGFRKTPRAEVTVVEEVVRGLGGLETRDLERTIEQLKLQAEQSRAAQNELLQDASQTPLVEVERIVDLGLSPAGNRSNTKPKAFLLGFFALVIGSVVALSIHPEELDVPFDSVDEIESQLGVPVVGGLNSSSTSTDIPGEDESKLNWANRMVMTSMVVVFAFAILVCCFLILDTQVRQTFAYDPFDGLSQIVWRLMGH